MVRRFTGGDQPVAAIMTAPVLTVGADDHLYRGGRLHAAASAAPHAGGGRGRAPSSGMLELHEALAVAAGPLVEDIDRLTHEDSLAGLAEVKAAQVQLAERLLADGVPAPEIQALIADINNDIHRRVLRLLVAELAAEGRGPPPVPFACIVMGSGGRGESLLFPDQDNGFVLADYPDERHGEIDPWFVELATRMTTALDGLQFPLCDGGVMATQPDLAQDPAAVAPAGRDLDARPGARRCCSTARSCSTSAASMATCGAGRRRCARFVTEAAARDRAFLHADVRAAGRAPRRHRAVRPAAAPSAGRARIRARSTSSCTARCRWRRRVRLLALAHGIAATGTLARLEALQASGALGADDADHLRERLRPADRAAAEAADRRLPGRAAESATSSIPAAHRARARPAQATACARSTSSARGSRADLTGSLL